MPGKFSILFLLDTNALKVTILIVYATISNKKMFSIRFHSITIQNVEILENLMDLLTGKGFKMRMRIFEEVDAMSGVNGAEVMSF